MTMKWFIHMGMLGMCSVEDWREKKISLWKIKLYAGIILFYEAGSVMMRKEEFYVWLLGGLAGLLPGIGMLLLGRLSCEAIGYGDGYLTLILGLSVGFWNIMGILLTAFLGAFTAAWYMIFVRRRSRKSQIAFVPFLFLGMAGTWIWTGM